MIQIFEVLEVREEPYYLTVEVEDATKVGDVLTTSNSHKVYLLVDHGAKRIWTYNGQKSSLKLQIFGGILAGILRKKIGIFYRIFPLNKYHSDDPEFLSILEQPLGPGKATTIDKKDFSKSSKQNLLANISIHNPRLNKALENINSYSTPEVFKRIFLIIAGTIYSDEEIPKTFISEEESSDKLVKMGRLNNGFTFFDDRNYSTRVVIKNRSLQGIELYVHDYDKMPILHIKSPIIYEEKFSEEGDINKLFTAFQIPDSLPDVEPTENEKQA
jgi:hypothetical protein